MADARSPRCSRRSRRPTASDKPQIAWALAALQRAERVRRRARGVRARSPRDDQRLDGYPAFDPDSSPSMVSLDKLATLASDESDGVRQLVATVLSRTGDPKWTSTLITLVQDKELEVGREAAVGLGKIANEEAIDAAPRRARQGRQGLAQRSSSRRFATASARNGLDPRAATRCQNGPREVPDEADLRHARGARGSARRRRARRSTSRRTRSRTGRPRPRCASPRSATCARCRRSRGA